MSRGSQNRKRCTVVFFSVCGNRRCGGQVDPERLIQEPPSYPRCRNFKVCPVRVKEKTNMGQSPIKSFRSTLRAILPYGLHWLDRQRRGKRKLIDFVCKRLHVRSIADLGGVWGVDGEYTFYAMEKHRIETAFLVDITFTDTLLEKKEKYPGLKIISGNFGDTGVARQIE